MMAKRKGRGPSLSQLTQGTHKGRPTTTKQNPWNGKAGLGVSYTGLKADPRLTAAAMTRITPTPSGPEPGHGGTTY